jgi:prefoldin subunit 5
MMKKLRFETLELLSHRERKARRIEFHPLLTVIQGANDVGKSSVIKSLYWTFGASPTRTHPTWAKANVKALVTFTIDGHRYRIFRDHNAFGIFGADGKLLFATNQITRELAPFLGELLDFKLVFTNRNGEPEIPPPAYAFLPFYVDQDGGWTKPLDSFASLSQYANFRKALLEFHTGIFPNEYYELEADKRRVQLDQRELEADRRIVRKAIERFNLEPSFDGLELSIDGHEQAIENLLTRLKQIREVRQDRANKLAEILDQRMIIEQQMQAVRASITELEKDATFAGDLPEQIFCPTCGTMHRNDFANRYGIVDDREACFEFLTDAKEKVGLLTSEALKAESDVRDADRILAEIQLSLDTKQDEVSLFEVIESQGRRIASNLFDGQLNALDSQIAALLGKIANIDDRLKELKDKKRREEIVRYYSGFVLDYLRRLDVTNYSADAITKIPASISETGSDLPRALLAYFLAILRTIHKHSTSLFAPIVVDSPNQQDQDDINVGAMIDLIIAARPDDAQTILGTVSLHGRSIENGKVIELTEKLSVLQSDEFDDTVASMQPYVEQMSV